MSWDSDTGLDTDTTLRPQAHAPPTFRYKGISVLRRIAALTTR